MDLTFETNSQPLHILLVRGRAHMSIVAGVPPEYLHAPKKQVGDEV